MNSLLTFIAFTAQPLENMFIKEFENPFQRNNLDAKPLSVSLFMMAKTCVAKIKVSLHSSIPQVY